MHPLGGGMDLRHGLFLVKMYAKMKELGPIGGRAPGTPPPLDPPMVTSIRFVKIKLFLQNSLHSNPDQQVLLRYSVLCSDN